MEKIKSSLLKAFRFAQASPKTTAFGGILLLCVWVFFSGEETSIEKEDYNEKPKIDSIEKAADPRDVWADRLSRDYQDLGEKIESQKSAQEEKFTSLVASLEEKIRILEEKTSQQESKKPTVRVIQKPPTEIQPPPQRKRFVHLSQSFESRVKKDPNTYVAMGSQARAVLLTGVVAETGTDAASSPQPILMRLVDGAIFSKWKKNNHIKEAILIGACHGQLSSERAKCRLESLSLVNESGEILEKKVEGWAIGEDGREGLKGIVVDKASEVTRMAMLNGILGGVSSFFQNQATSSVFPVSPISGQTNSLTGKTALKAGAASGVGSALQKLADYAIKRAEQMNPVLVVGSGRVVDVVFKQGFSLEEDPKKSPNTNVSSSPSASVQTSSRDQEDLRQGGWAEAQRAAQSMQMGRGQGDF